MRNLAPSPTHLRRPWPNSGPEVATAARGAAGVEAVVTSCSDCFHAIARLYPPLGPAFKVTHTAFLLSPLAEFIDRLAPAP